MNRSSVPRSEFLILAGCATDEPASIPCPRRTVALASRGLAAWRRSDVAFASAGHPCARSVMIDARSGLTLYQKHADAHIQVASTQKLLTALIILRRGNLDGRLLVSPPDTYVEPSKLGLRPGQVYTRRTLLSAMMVK